MFCQGAKINTAGLNSSSEFVDSPEEKVALLTNWLYRTNKRSTSVSKLFLLCSLSNLKENYKTALRHKCVNNCITQS